MSQLMTLLWPCNYESTVGKGGIARSKAKGTGSVPSATAPGHGRCPCTTHIQGPHWHLDPDPGRSLRMRFVPRLLRRGGGTFSCSAAGDRAAGESPLEVVV